MILLNFFWLRSSMDFIEFSFFLLNLGYLEIIIFMVFLLNFKWMVLVEIIC